MGGEVVGEEAVGEVAVDEMDIVDTSVCLNVIDKIHCFSIINIHHFYK
jgi:hypothetical protein